MAESVSAATHNNRLWPQFKQGFARLDDPVSFSAIAAKFQKWLSNPKAYYTEAQPHIIDLLQTAQATTMHSAGFTDPRTHLFRARDYPSNPWCQSYVELVKVIQPFIGAFELEMQKKVLSLLQTISNIPVSHPPLSPKTRISIQIPPGFRTPSTPTAVSASMTIPTLTPNPLTALPTPPSSVVAKPKKRKSLKLDAMLAQDLEWFQKQAKDKSVERIVDIDLTTPEPEPVRVEVPAKGAREASADVDVVEVRKSVVTEPVVEEAPSVPPEVQKDDPPVVVEEPLPPPPEPAEPTVVVETQEDAAQEVVAEGIQSASTAQVMQVEEPPEPPAPIIEQPPPPEKEADIPAGPAVEEPTNVEPAVEEPMNVDMPSEPARVFEQEVQQDELEGGEEAQVLAILSQNPETESTVADKEHDTISDVHQPADESSSTAAVPSTSAATVNKRTDLPQVAVLDLQAAGDAAERLIIDVISSLGGSADSPTSEAPSDMLVDELETDEEPPMKRRRTEEPEALDVEASAQAPEPAPETEYEHPAEEEEGELESDISDSESEEGEVDPERNDSRVLTVRRWGKFTVTFKVTPEHFTCLSKWRNKDGVKESLCLSLGCCTMDAFNKARDTHGDNAPLETLVRACQVSWPRSNELSARVKNSAKSAVSIHLSPPVLLNLARPGRTVDITAYVTEGDNTVEFELLEERAQGEFVLFVLLHHPSWAQRVERAERRRKDREWRGWIKDMCKPLAATSGPFFAVTPMTV